MEIPRNDDGFHQVSATQLRTYGAGGFRLLDQEAARGCPRQYHEKYVEHRPEFGQKSFPLLYGSVIHDALYRMEEHRESPEDALAAVWDPDLEPDAWEEAATDLNEYLERGATPTDRFGTIAVEQDLSALLYVDEVYGPVYYRGILDWLGVDLDDPAVLHFVDYKTNRHPPSQDDLKGDVQMRGYDWLIRENWSRYMTTPTPRIVTHLDAIKWREVDWRYTYSEIEAWHSWAVAVVRKILRDEDHEPVLNPGCAYCPVQADCPAFLGLPGVGRRMTEEQPDPGSPDEVRLRWRDEANALRLLLENAVKAIDAEFKNRAGQVAVYPVGDEEFALVPDWRDEVDVQALHELLGQRFYDVITVGKGKVAALVKQDLGLRSAVESCFRRVPVGSKVERRKRT
jgi:hypothetical protein